MGLYQSEQCRLEKTAKSNDSVQSTNILHLPIAEVPEETEWRHFDPRLENENGRKEKVEYLERKL